MIISPAPSPTNSEVHAPGPQDIRKIVMRVNQTPGYVPPSPEASQAQVGELPGLQRQANIDPNDNQAEQSEATEPLSPRLAAIAKQRRALQVKERELLERERALSNPAADQGMITKAQLKTKPLDVLLDAGVTYDELAEAILARQSNPEINALKAEIEALKQGVDQKWNERDQQTEQQVLAEMQKEAEQLVADGDDFELVRGMGRIPDVMKLIKRNYDETGEVLDVREALKLVEDELLVDAEKITGYNKIRSRFSPQTPEMQRHQGMRTLTNRDTASVPMSAKARALAAFNGTLRR